MNFGTRVDVPFWLRKPTMLPEHSLIISFYKAIPSSSNSITLFDNISQIRPPKNETNLVPVMQNGQRHCVQRIQGGRGWEIWILLLLHRGGNETNIILSFKTWFQLFLIFYFSIFHFLQIISFYLRITLSVSLISILFKL